MDSHIYKVCAKAEWDSAQAAGAYEGSAVDARDGYIHFSTASQLDETLTRHFQGQADQVALVVPVEALRGADLKWEPSRDGALFPHLYGGPLPVSAVIRVVPLVNDSQGVPRLPKEESDG